MSYRIVCTEQEPVYRPTSHAHIVAVGTGTDPDHADDRWTREQVVYAIDVQGKSFYTVGRYTGKVAYVETIACPDRCGTRIVRSKPDVTTDNNLDSLRRCNWTS
jgi:hypothetical protein